MKVKVLLFGMLADKTGTRILIIEDAEGMVDLAGLKNYLESKYSFLKEMKYIIAANQQITRKNIKLNEGDEIALMPPFAGG